ncbi:MAG: hypothetical protein IJS29_06310 [Selenomonadaceae bacterium]|nr:hypothetical protein [Selenomonadaceae bacterium]
MESIEKRKLKSRIAEVINNVENMSDEELIKAYQKINESIKEMPRNERGEFEWESGIEILTMIVLGIEQKKLNKEKV